MGERDYSHRSLIDKLGIKEGMSVFLLNVSDPIFLADIAKQPVTITDHLKEPHDVILFEANTTEELAQFHGLKQRIQKKGAIWAVYPKGRKDLREVDVIDAGKHAGLIDNKVVKFSETHTGLRFVIPINQR